MHAGRRASRARVTVTGGGVCAGAQDSTKAYVIVFRSAGYIAPGTELTFDYDGGHPSIRRHAVQQADAEEAMGRSFVPEAYKWTEEEVRASPQCIECQCGAGPMCRGHFFMEHAVSSNSS